MTTPPDLLFVPTLAAWPLWLVNITMALFVLVCLLLIMTVLIQKPQGGGLAGAFGSGAGSGQTAFGTKTGDALTWMTVSIFVLFVIVAVVLNVGVKSIVRAHDAAARTQQESVQPTALPPGTSTQPAPTDTQPATAQPAQPEPSPAP